MKSFPILICTIVSLLKGADSYGAVYDTLPKNANTLAFKQVVVSQIKSEYNSSGKDTSLDLREEFTSNRLEDISQIIQSYFQQLKALSPEAYNNFSLGEFSADVTADISAQGLGIGHGLTDRLTVYGAIPVYHIKTDVKFYQSKQSNIAAIQASIQNTNPDTALGKFVKDLTLQLPNTNAEVLQSLVVNFYDYKPIGKWEKDALGDAEVGFIYRLTDFTDKGLAIATGAVLPTGESDDPDSLQDISTGDGQYDAFLELNSGISFFDNIFQLDLKGRYTYQFASKKEVRSIENAQLPLSRHKQQVYEKLGNKIDSTLSFTYNPTYWMNLNSSFILEKIAATTYSDVSDPKVKNALENNTASSGHWIKLGIGFSTVEAFKRKRIDIPMDIGLSAQRLLNAKNTANYDRIDLDFRLYF